MVPAFSLHFAHYFILSFILSKPVDQSSAPTPRETPRDNCSEAILGPPQLPCVCGDDRSDVLQILADIDTRGELLLSCYALLRLQFLLQQRWVALLVPTRIGHLQFMAHVAQSWLTCPFPRPRQDNVMNQSLTSASPASGRSIASSTSSHAATPIARSTIPQLQVSSPRPDPATTEPTDESSVALEMDPAVLSSGLGASCGDEEYNCSRPATARSHVAASENYDHPLRSNKNSCSSLPLVPPLHLVDTKTALEQVLVEETPGLMISPFSPLLNFDCVIQYFWYIYFSRLPS